MGSDTRLKEYGYGNHGFNKSTSITVADAETDELTVFTEKLNGTKEFYIVETGGSNG